MIKQALTVIGKKFGGDMIKIPTVADPNGTQASMTGIASLLIIGFNRKIVLSETFLKLINQVYFYSGENFESNISCN